MERALSDMEKLKNPDIKGEVIQHGDRTGFGICANICGPAMATSASAVERLTCCLMCLIWQAAKRSEADRPVS